MSKELRLPKVNSVVISGRLTRDIELRYTKTGMPITSLPIAFDRSYKDSSGEWQQQTSFLDVVVWNKNAERCAQELVKGSAVLVEGYLQTRSYLDKENQNRKVTEIVANRVHILEKSELRNDGSSFTSPSKDVSIPETTEDDVPF